jgi:hypothetical protein
MAGVARRKRQMVAELVEVHLGKFKASGAELVNRAADREGDRDRNEGEASLRGRAVPLVDEQDAAVAETRTGAEGANRFVGVPAGRYRAEAEPSPEWAGALAGALTVGTEPVTLGPLGLPPAGNAGEEGALPAEAGVPAEERPGTAVSTAAGTYWALLGATLPTFRSRKDRRSAAEAARHGGTETWRKPRPSGAS